MANAINDVMLRINDVTPCGTNDVALCENLWYNLYYKNQIGRSATSVCANIAESKYGHSRADFIAKLDIKTAKSKKV